MELREKIHSLWEAFFPSSLYLLLFVGIGILFLGATGLVSSINPDEINLEELKNNAYYKILKDIK